MEETIMNVKLVKSKETWAEYCSRIQEWHEVFLWFPMFVGRTWYWFETVERRAVWEEHGQTKQMVWEYRDPFTED
jgi:chlorite dismutase